LAFKGAFHYFQNVSFQHPAFEALQAHGRFGTRQLFWGWAGNSIIHFAFFAAHSLCDLEGRDKTKVLSMFRCVLSLPFEKADPAYSAQPLFSWSLSVLPWKRGMTKNSLVWFSRIIFAGISTFFLAPLAAYRKTSRGARSFLTLEAHLLTTFVGAYDACGFSWYWRARGFWQFSIYRWKVFQFSENLNFIAQVHSCARRTSTHRYVVLNPSEQLAKYPFYIQDFYHLSDHALLSPKNRIYHSI